MKEKSGAAATAKSYLLALTGCVCLITLDQFTKRLAYARLKGRPPFAIWKGVFSLQYLENRGAAFGMMQGGGPFFLAAAVIILLVIGVMYGKMPHTKRFYLLRICAVLLCSGAVGNMIDRVKTGYVVDLFYFELIDFPIFNVADCYVVIAGALFIFAALFYYKEDEFRCFSRKKGENDKGS